MMLIDSFGRTHRDLRVSLTDRCSLRCTYCMPAEGLPWLPSEEVLSSQELIRIIKVAADCGIEAVRLTGGEPLLRPDVVDIVRELAAITPRLELSMTTNGIRLPSLAAPLADAGLRRVNISLDTLRRERFVALTRRDRLVDVMAGVAAAKAAGLAPVKINTVLMRGVNDDEAVELLTWALAEQVQLRFIEQMPLDAQHGWERNTMVSAAEIVAALSTQYSLTPVTRTSAAPASEWLVDGGPATVGVVASVSTPFCAACDRLRLTSDGQLRSCLFAQDETDLRTALRAGASDDELQALFEQCTLGKRQAHGIGEPGFVQPQRPMSSIGG